MLRLLSNIRRTASALHDLARSHQLTNPALEIIYRDLFLRELHQVGLPDEYYPVGPAANHALLYFLARALRTLPVKRIMELGGGQSTILIDRMLHKLSLDLAVQTVEHDEVWARELVSSVRHQVLLAPLRPTVVEGHSIGYYSHPALVEGEAINLLVVDGPPSYGRDVRMNRIGALDLVRGRLASDFIVVIDDSERDAEQVLVRQVRESLTQQGRAFRGNTIVAAKRLTVFAGGDLLRASFF